jgi:hypothetical protein
MLAGIQRRCRRATALVSLAPLTAFAVASLNFAAVAFGADFYDGSHGLQPSPPYDYGARAYPPQRYLPPREGPYNRHSSIDQPPPYDDRTPVYPSQRHLSSRDGRYGERYTYQQPPYDFGYPRRRYGDHQTYDRGAPAYRPYRPAPNGYDQAYQGNGYGPDGPAESMPPRPPAPIDGPPRGWIADPRDFPDNGVAEAVPPYEAWPVYPPRGRH